MAERKGDTKSSLLDELESIKDLLVDEDDIPILQEVIESFEPVSSNSPRQNALFPEEPLTERKRQRTPQPTRATGENPFLPAHIRERLQGNQPPPLLDTRDFAEPAPKENPGAANSAPSPLTRSSLINALMDELRPELEARLRESLESLSQDLLVELLSEDPSSHNDD